MVRSVTGTVFREGCGVPLIQPGKRALIRLALRATFSREESKGGIADTEVGYFNTVYNKRF